MRAADRRLVASALAGGIVGGFVTGDSPTWAGNLVTLVAVGGVTSVLAWCLLTAAADLLSRGPR